MSCCCVTVFECIGLVCRAITFLWQSPAPFPANCFCCFLSSPLLLQANWQFEVSNHFFIYTVLVFAASPFPSDIYCHSSSSLSPFTPNGTKTDGTTAARHTCAETGRKKIILRIPNKFLANNKKWTASQVLFVSLYLYFWLEKNHPFTRVFLIQFLLLLDIIFYFRTRSFLLISHPPPRFATLRIRSFPHIVFCVLLPPIITAILIPFFAQFLAWSSLTAAFLPALATLSVSTKPEVPSSAKIPLLALKPTKRPTEKTLKILATWRTTTTKWRRRRRKRRTTPGLPRSHAASQDSRLEKKRKLSIKKSRGKPCAHPLPILWGDESRFIATLERLGVRMLVGRGKRGRALLLRSLHTHGAILFSFAQLREEQQSHAVASVIAQCPMVTGPTRRNRVNQATLNIFWSNVFLTIENSSHSWQKH